jgi:multidrug efflux pump subunit AcrA (membrane-fusion protein)
VANFMGQFVRKGEPLLSLYSPELLASQDEYLRAREAGLRLANSELPEVSKGAAELVQAAHHRLILFDVPPSLIERIEKTGRPEETVTLVAPQTGFVTGKDIFDGTRIEPGLTLFTITDLSTVWVEADVYEEEASLVAMWTKAVITLPYQPDFQAVGNASFISPTLDPATRTVRVRFEIPNPALELKPGMFANVEINVEESQGILIPDDAIIDSGLRKVVFVEREPGTFEPREVKVGLRGEGKAQILAGVEEGDHVVIRANFLLDSESRLKAALTGFSGQHQHGGTP